MQSSLVWKNYFTLLKHIIKKINHFLLTENDVKHEWIKSKVKKILFSLSWSSYPRHSIKKAVLKSFAIFTGKHLCWCFFLIKLQFWEFASLLKKTPTQSPKRLHSKTPRLVFLWILRKFSGQLFWRTSTNDEMKVTKWKSVIKITIKWN